MSLSPDRLTDGARLQATYIGYGVASRPVPTGTGELSVGELQMAARAVQLEGVTATGTAIAAERRGVTSRTLVVDPENQLWQRVSPDVATAALEMPPLQLPNLRWVVVSTLQLEGVDIVRVEHAAEDGTRLELYQARSPFAVEAGEGMTVARRTRTDELYMIAVGAVEEAELVDLLRRATPIG